MNSHSTRLHALKYRDYSAFTIGSAVSVLMLILHPGSLFYPAYWDTMLGCLYEATWLYRNNLDYSGLAEQLPYVNGGPRVYFLTIWTYFHAVLLMLTSGNSSFFLPIAHLINLFAAGMIIGFTWDIIRREAGHSAAWIASIILFALPLWQTQAVLINMDVPMFAFAYWGMAFALRGKALSSLISFTIAQLIKISAAFPALVLGGAVMLRIKKARDLWLTAPAAATLLLMFFMNRILKTLPHSSSAGSISGLDFLNLLIPWRYPVYLMELWNRSPESFLLLLCGFIGVIIRLYHIYKKDKTPWPYRLWSMRYEASVPLMCMAGIIGMIMFVAGFEHFLLRYTLIVLPMAAMGFALGLIHLSAGTRVIAVFLTLIIFIAGHHGFLARYLSSGSPISFQSEKSHPDLPIEYRQNNGYILERSFEFRSDMDLMIQVTRELSDAFSEKIIVSSWPLVHALRLPEMGYVRTADLRVMTSNRAALTWEGTEHYWRYIRENHHKHRPTDFVWVWQPNIFSSPEPDWDTADIDVIAEFTKGYQRIVVYQYKRWPLMGRQGAVAQSEISIQGDNQSPE